MPKLKICGVTSADFAKEAARRQVDYLGLIFATASPRRVDIDAARAIISAARTSRFVGVFAGETIEAILAIAASAPLDVIQLHGGYGADDVAKLKDKGYEVWRLYDGIFAGEDATLLDGCDGARRGGTGQLADWSLARRLKQEGRRLVLAGGISPENIIAAVATGADIIDVNSSLETSPGMKSIEKLDCLITKMQGEK